MTRALLALLFLLSPAAFAQAGTAETKSAAARPKPAGQTAPALVPISQSNSVPAKSPAQQAPAPALTDAAGALAEAQAALQAKQYDAAIALMNGVLEKEPDNTEALHYRASAFFARGKQNSAVIDLEHALEVNSED